MSDVDGGIGMPTDGPEAPLRPSSREINGGQRVYVQDLWLYGAIGALTAAQANIDQLARGDIVTWMRFVIAVALGALVAVKAKRSNGKPE